MITSHKRNCARIHLYVVMLTAQTAHSIVLPLIPFVNERLQANSMEFALSFSGYYITTLISSLYFGKISDYIGRRKTINLSLLGLTIGYVLSFWTNKVIPFLIFRIATGLFDSIVVLSQAYIADIISLKERPRYFAQLESVTNISQCVGPLIAGVLSVIDLYIPLWIAAGLCGFALIYSLIFLPETVEDVIEKKKILATFELVEKQQKARNISLLDYEESKQIKDNFIKNLHKKEQERKHNSKLEMNYLMVIAIVGEFCNKWVFSSFDTVVCIYGKEQYQIDAFAFSMMSVVGSLFNIVQTGWLFSFLMKKDVSIPIVASWAGLTGIVAMICCIYFGKIMFLIGGTTIIIAYGFAAPAAPAILSAESSEETQGKAISTIMIGGLSAMILSPLILNNLYPIGKDIPFYVTLLPCAVLFVMMVICNYLPGGRLAGQVTLADSLEFELQSKIAKMEGGSGKKSEIRYNDTKENEMNEVSLF